MSINPLLAAVETPPVALVQSWVKGQNYPEDRPLLDLAQAAPGWPMAEPLVAHISQAIQKPATARYAPILGEVPLRDALAAEIARLYGGAVHGGNIAITSGCNQAYVAAVMALAREGDAVMLPTPWYFNHKMTLDMFGIEAISLPCDPNAGMLPDAEAASLIITKKTRAIVLVTPNNPTGAIYPPATITAFADLARAHGIKLIIDETYRDFIPSTGPSTGPSGDSSDAAPHHAFHNPDWADTIIQLYSFSKAYAMPGLRVGAVTAGEDVINLIQKALDSIAICANGAGQAAALFGIQSLKHWRDGKREEMAQRLAAFETAIAPVANQFPIASAGAFFTYCRHPFDLSALEAAKLLADEASIMAMPGSAFGPGQEQMIRFAFGNIAPEQAAFVGERLAALSR